MTTSSEAQNKEATTIKKWNRTDTVWMFGLYGVAVGAGTLFLPISAGLNGPLVLLLMIALAFPLTYFPHLALSRFVLSGSSRDGNINDVVVEHFGVYAGKIIMAVYFLAFFPIVLVYSLSITNSLDSFLVNQFGIAHIPRVWLSFIVVLLLNLILVRGKDTIVNAMSVLVVPMVIFLVTLSIYLIPQWQGVAFFAGVKETDFSDPSLWRSLWLVLPAMVFAFSHAPIISSFSSTQKSIHGDNAERRCARIMRYSYTLICITVLFFVVSCVLTLTRDDMLLAQAQNINVLSAIANKFDNPIIAYVAPVMAMLAMSKSFLGTSLGVNEGATSIVDAISRALGKPFTVKVTNRIALVLMFLLTWAATVWNPSALHIIETISGPLIAVILFILPMFAVWKVPAMKKYRSPVNIFIGLTGIISLSALVYSLG